MSGDLPTRVVQTPEGIRFALRLATPATRGLAAALDFAVVALLARLIGMLASVMLLLHEDLGRAFHLLLYFALGMGYGMALEWLWRGQTIGKRLLGLRVMDARGLPLRLPQVVLRNLLRAVDALPLLYVVGGVSAWLSRHGQRLGDMAAETIVVRVTQPSPPDIAALGVGGYNSFRRYPYLEARLRQRVSPEEAAIAFEALRRRDELAPEARLRLFAELATDLRARAPFPAEVAEELADEQYVRNAIDTLHRKS